MKTQNDYSDIRGFCYIWKGTPADWERELTFAQRLNLNSTRIWVKYNEYFKNPDAYIAKLKSFIDIAWAKGISVMPVIFNGNMIDTAILAEEWRATGDKYVKHLIESIKDEEGLIMWDIMNEPTCNDYILLAKEAEVTERKEVMWRFVRHYCDLVKSLDAKNPVTVGHMLATDAEPTVDCVDVISFHDYSDSSAKINRSYDVAEELSKKTGKPILNSELCCLCRGNPYDLALKICQERKVGWYLFELMIHDYWGEVHGLVYPDGTIRDPSTIAAVMGFFRNHDPNTRIKPRANREGNVEKVLVAVQEAMKDDITMFRHKDNDVNVVLEAAERCISYLESCELVPMYEPPSVQLRRYREQENPNLEEVRAWTYDLAMQLKRSCNII